MILPDGELHIRPYVYKWTTLEDKNTRIVLYMYHGKPAKKVCYIVNV